VPRVPGVNHLVPYPVGEFRADRYLAAVRALEKLGVKINRRGKHIVMTDGNNRVTLPRHKPIQAFTMGGHGRGVPQIAVDQRRRAVAAVASL